MKKTLWGVGSTLALLALIGAGCAATNETSPAPAETPAPAAVDNQPADTTTAPVTTASVTIENFAYAPATLTVKKGTVVTWRNLDGVAHTVTGNNGGPDSQLFGQGKSYSYTFDTVGTFPYFCKPHPNMKGTVVVQE